MTPGLSLAPAEAARTGVIQGAPGSGVRDSGGPGPEEQKQWVLTLVPLLRRYENTFHNRRGPRFLRRRSGHGNAGQRDGAY